ncbi:hypothetical protein Cgig2_031552 [Carnegiea gigantea]|uniref:Reverse transcriptase zinc-binding domain-containing protein n=1 Tax=Carnegiea gigantea TaxID=171969 RepID=A0A9Q1JG83_9CARY|nr:hypothetical protein Cgig2_031552 [Carnegiea gigantea]
MLDHIFLPVDADIIKSISLCNSWPRNRIMWHYSPNGKFLVESTYHMIQQLKGSDMPTCSSERLKTFWADLWSLVIPSKINLFPWRAVLNILPSRAALARIIPSMHCTCEICGMWEESANHALFDCSLARPSCLGVVKVNYDGAKSCEWSHGMEAVIRDSTRAVWRVVVNKNGGCVEPEYVEAKACKWAMEQALEYASRFEFCSFNHVKRMENRVAHTIVHAQPLNSTIRVWLDEVLDFISGLIAHDTYNVVIR